MANYARFPADPSSFTHVADHNELENRNEAGNHEKIIPLINTVDAFQITKSDGITPILNIDAANNRIGLNTDTPAWDIESVVAATTALGSVLQLRNSGIGNNSSNMIRFICSGVANATQGSCEIEAFRTNEDANGDTAMVFRTVKGTVKSDQMLINPWGNIGVGVAVPNAKLDVDGGIKVANDTDDASALKVGTARYRTDADNSYYEICMQTAIDTYAWKIVHTGEGDFGSTFKPTRVDVSAADSPVTLVEPFTNTSYIYAVNLTDGDVTINLPAVNLALEGLKLFIYIEINPNNANVLTINTNGADTVRDKTSINLNVLRDGLLLTPHTYLINHWDALSWERTDEIVYQAGNAGVESINTLQELLNYSFSSGQISGCVVTDNLDGTIAVTAGEWKLRDEDTAFADCRVYAVPADASLTPLEGTSYLVVNYNGGNPSWTIEADITSVACQSTCVQAVLYKDGTDIKWISLGDYSTDFSGRYAKSKAVTDWLEYGSGLMISNPATLKIATTSGRIYQGTIGLDIPEFNTNVADTLTFYYRDGIGGWTKVLAQTDLDNLNYDDGTGTLAPLNVGRYSNTWLYVLVDDSSELVAVYGQAQYNSLAGALTEEVPSVLPPFASKYSVGRLIGRVTTKQNNDASFENISSVFTEVFTSGTPTNHNDLSGRDAAGNHAKIVPIADSETAFQITKADGTTPVFNVDTTNEIIGLRGIVQTASDTFSAVRIDGSGATSQQNVAFLRGGDRKWFWGLGAEEVNPSLIAYSDDLTATILKMNAVTGNVGVRVATPTEALDVGGNITATGSIGASISHPTTTGNVTTLHTSQVNASSEATASGDRSQVNASSDSTASGERSQVNASANSIANELLSQVNASNRIINNTQFSSVWGYAPPGDTLEANQTIRLESVGGHAFFKGNVRIGENIITSPSIQAEALRVVGATTISGLLTASAGLAVNDITGGVTGNQIKFTKADGTTPVLTINTSDYEAGVEGTGRRVTFTGFESKINAGEDGRARLVMECGGADADQSLISFRKVDTTDWLLGSGTTSTPSFIIYNSARAQSDIRIVYDTGNVAIPAAYSNPITTGRDMRITSAGTLGYQSSVRASKKNIDYNLDSSWIYDLKPVSFEYRKQDEDGKFLEETDGVRIEGLIAEDVNEVRPEMCYKDDDGTLRGVEYKYIISSLLNEVQKLNKRISELEKK